MVKGKATIFAAAYLAIVFISGASSQTQAEINDELNKAKTATQGFESFLKTLETNEVQKIQSNAHQLLPVLKSFRPLFAFAANFFDGANSKLDVAKEAFRLANERFAKLDIGLADLRDSDEEVLRRYKKKRDPVADVANAAQLYAQATSPQESKRLLQSLQDQCSNTDPDNYFSERHHHTHYTVASLSGGDRARLNKWIKVIVVDSLRAISMHQVCLGVSNPPASQSRADADLANQRVKLEAILGDLKKEGERIEDQWESKVEPELKELISVHGSATDLHNRVYQKLSAKYTRAFFGVYVLNAEYEKSIFNSNRTIEVSLPNERTLVVFWVGHKEHSQTRQDAVKEYLENVNCDYYRSKTIGSIEDSLRNKGATGVYVTDQNLYAIAMAQASKHFKKTCEGAHGSYGRTIIAGY